MRFPQVSSNTKTVVNNEPQKKPSRFKKSTRYIKQKALRIFIFSAFFACLTYRCWLSK